MEVYRNFNIKPVINAQSWVTKLGGSRMKEEVLHAMNEASKVFVDVGNLHKKCSEEIAKMCSAESALITSGCASAMVLMSAAVICAREQKLINEMPNLDFVPEILIHRGQRNHYDSAFEMTGAKLVEFGYKQKTEAEIVKKINCNTRAIAFIEAPFLDKSLGINKIVEIAKKHNIPVIVDASSRIPPVDNLFKFIKAGAQMVAYSGGKGIRGPQNTGFIIGENKFVEEARKNLICFGDKKAKIGRSMKVSKECLVGLVTALKIFLDTDQKRVWKEWKQKAEFLVDEFQEIKGLKVQLEDGGDNREGPQAVIYFEKAWKGLKPDEIRKELLKGDPPICVGGGGYGDEINLVMTNLQAGEEKVISNRLKDLLHMSYMPKIQI